MPRRPGTSTLVRVDARTFSRLQAMRDRLEAAVVDGRGARPHLDSPVSMGDVITELLWQADCHNARTVKANARKKEKASIEKHAKGG